MKFDMINVRFKLGIYKRIKKIGEKLYYGISVSDYIRQHIISAIKQDENILVNKGLIKKNMSGAKGKHEEDGNG